MKSKDVAVLLHNIRSAHNVGSIFRTSDGAGVSKIYVSGYSPTPLDRFGSPRKDMHKVALGAEKFIPWEYIKNPYTVISSLHEKGWHVVGVEQDARSVDYRTFNISGPTLFVFGNEVRGISSALRAHCDTLIEIPMSGKKESLNVSVAAGIVLFEYA